MSSTTTEQVQAPVPSGPRHASGKVLTGPSGYDGRHRTGTSSETKKAGA